MDDGRDWIAALAGASFGLTELKVLVILRPESSMLHVWILLVFGEKVVNLE